MRLKVRRLDQSVCVWLVSCGVGKKIFDEGCCGTCSRHFYFTFTQLFKSGALCTDLLGYSHRTFMMNSSFHFTVCRAKIVVEWKIDVWMLPWRCSGAIDHSVFGFGSDQGTKPKLVRLYNFGVDLLRYPKPALWGVGVDGEGGVAGEGGRLGGCSRGKGVDGKGVDGTESTPFTNKPTRALVFITGAVIWCTFLKCLKSHFLQRTCGTRESRFCLQISCYLRIGARPAARSPKFKDPDQRGEREGGHARAVAAPETCRTPPSVASRVRVLTRLS